MTCFILKGCFKDEGKKGIANIKNSKCLPVFLIKRLYFVRTYLRIFIMSRGHRLHGRMIW